MGGADSRNQENGLVFQAGVRDILKKGHILHVFIISQIALLSFQGSHRTQTQTSEVRCSARFSGH